MICGVDEAGKGSVLGPMVIAAVGAESENSLAGLQVKDSKLLSPERRIDLCREIQKRCIVSTVIIPADRIDASRAEITMNECVARAHAAAIRRLRPQTAYLDACDVNAARYRDMVSAHLKDPCIIISEHRADSTYRIVSAASIVAKVTRDQEISKLALLYGEIGSGYPSDEKTIAFLKFYMKNNHRSPPIARRSWNTVKKLIAALEQQSLP